MIQFLWKVGVTLNRLKELRKQKGDTLESLSKNLKEKFGLSLSTGQLSSYENENRSPRDNSVWDTLANYFGVPVAYLLGYEKMTVGDKLDVLTQINTGNLIPSDDFTQSLSEENKAFIEKTRRLYNRIKNKVKNVDLNEKQKEIDSLLSLTTELEREVLQKINYRDSELTEIEIEAIKLLINDLERYTKDLLDGIVFLKKAISDTPPKKKNFPF